MDTNRELFIYHYLVGMPSACMTAPNLQARPAEQIRKGQKLQERLFATMYLTFQPLIAPLSHTAVKQ